MSLLKLIGVGEINVLKLINNKCCLYNPFKDIRKQVYFKGNISSSCELYLSLGIARKGMDIHHPGFSLDNEFLIFIS